MIPHEMSEAVTRGLREAFGVTEFEDISRINRGRASSLVFRIIVRGSPYAADYSLVLRDGFPLPGFIGQANRPEWSRAGIQGLSSTHVGRRSRSGGQRREDCLRQGSLGAPRTERPARTIQRSTRDCFRPSQRPMTAGVAPQPASAPVQASAARSSAETRCYTPTIISQQIPRNGNSRE